MGPYNIVNYQHQKGSTFIDPWQVQGDDGNGTLAAKDITGATITFKLGNRPVDDTPVMSLSSATTGVEITDAENGYFQIEVPAADWDALDSGELYYHECIITYADGQVDMLFKGSLRLMGGIS